MYESLLNLICNLFECSFETITEKSSLTHNPTSPVWFLQYLFSFKNLLASCIDFIMTSDMLPFKTIGLLESVEQMDGNFQGFGWQLFSRSLKKWNCQQKINPVLEKMLSGGSAKSGMATFPVWLALLKNNDNHGKFLGHPSLLPFLMRVVPYG